MDLCVIGDLTRAPQLVTLAKSGAAELDLVRRATADSDRTMLHRVYPLAAGWDQLAFRIATLRLSPYARSNGWYAVPASDACMEVDRAYRATQVPKPDKLPRPEYGAIMRHIRTNLFGVTQDVIAAISGASISRVSRWETGDQEPGLTEVHRLRQFAIAHGIPWDDSILHRLSEADEQRVA